ncbi:hypothetical protein BSKO_01233 [Bryopsis sp. KO-2023]|nr:hypothetical protein BSKO_01233 [Bryopsis sp. KO-2023]
MAVCKGVSTIKQADKFQKLAKASNHLESDIVRVVDVRDSLETKLAQASKENHETLCRLHKRELELKDLRQKSWMHSFGKHDNIHRVLANDSWMYGKYGKFDKQRQISSLRKNLKVLQGCLDDQRKRGARKLLKNSLQIAKVQSDLESAKEQHAKLLSQVENEEATIREFLEKPQNETTPYGIFVEKDNVLEGLDHLHLDIGKIHELEPDRRNFYLKHLTARYEQLAGLTSQLRSLVAKTRGFMQTLDMSETMSWVNGNVTEILECATVRVLLLDEHATFLWCITGSQGNQGDGEEEEEIRFPTNTGLTGLAISRKEIITSNSPETDEPAFDAEIDRYSSLPTVTMMIGPIMSSNDPSKPIGVIQAFNKRSEKQFDDRDRFLITAILQQASIALENAAAYESERKKEAINQNLLDIGRVLSSEHEFKTLSKMIITKAKKLLKADRCSIFFWNHETRRLTSNMTDASKTEFVVPENSVAGAVALTGSGTNVVDAYAVDNFNPDFDEKSGYRTCRILCLPIFGSDGHVLGVIQMIKGWPKSNPPKHLWMNADIDPFTKDDEEALGAFCGQAAIALENAKLYERMYGQPQFVDDLSKGVDVKMACTLVCSRVTDICSCEAARLVMETGDKQGLWSYDSPSATVVRLPHGGVVGATFNAKKCTILDHLNNPSILSPKSRRSGIRGKFDLNIDGMHGLPELRSTICIPIFDTSGSKVVIAVLQLANKSSGLPFNRQDEFMLKGFANQITVLLQSANLFDAVSLGKETQDRLMNRLEELNRMNTCEPTKDTKFHQWIEESVVSLVKADKCTLFWLNPEGRPIHPQHATPKSSNGVAHVAASGEHKMEIGNKQSDGVTLYTAVKGSGLPTGVFEVCGCESRKDILGDQIFNALEIDAICQFAHHVGIFVECATSKSA